MGIKIDSLLKYQIEIIPTVIFVTLGFASGTNTPRVYIIPTFEHNYDNMIMSFVKDNTKKSHRLAFVTRQPFKDF